MKKECEKFALYFYEELEPPQAIQFKAHLTSCPACQRKLAFLAKTAEVLTPPAAPQKVVDRVLGQVQASKKVYWSRVLKPAFAAVAVLGCGLLYWANLPINVPAAEGELVAYISVEADEEYNSFVRDFEVFENEF